MTNEEFINSLPKGNPFTTPEGYFDNLTNSVMSRIEKEGKPVFRMSHYFRYVAAASCIAFVVAAGILLTNHRSNIPVIQTSDENAAYWAYNLDKTALMAAVLEIEIPEIGMEIRYTDEQNREIISFLEEQNISIENIVQNMNEE
ncbi:MAG: hypothetical protein LBN37_06785 [Bacteroidales bacterium]|jgi:hypothetical protein|nr:hypothetical protein [Bacteroidales bacterium]